MGRMTSHCIKFKAVYCQETCKAARVCTELILEIPWSQTKDSTGKAEGGLKHSHANCCQLPELGQDAELCVAASRARAEQPSEDSLRTSFHLIPAVMLQQ